MKKDLRDHLKVFDKLNIYCWIAGGSVYDYFNGNKPADIDIFFKSEKDLNKAKDLLKRKGFKFIVDRNIGALFESKDGVKYDLLFLGKSPEHIFYNFFDFSVCCAAIDNKGNFFYHENYFEHCENKEIHYVETISKAFIFKHKRLKKYLNKGFNIDRDNLILWMEKVNTDNKEIRKKPFSAKQVPFMKIDKNNLKFNIIKTKLKP